MTDDFSWWQNALKGQRGPVYDGEIQSGFYRQRSGRKRQLAGNLREPAPAPAYEPIAFWKDASGQRGHINGKEVTEQRALETWQYCNKNPITAEAYWHRMDNGVWLDNDAAADAAAKGPEIDPEQDPVASLKAEIAAAKAGLAAYATIESDEAAARAQTLRSALTGLSGKAVKAYEALNRPLLDEQQRIRKVWFPLRDDAAAGAEDLRKAMGDWEDVKRENAKRAEEENRKREDQAARDAQFENAKPGLIHKEPPPPIQRVEPNTPPPATVIKGATGRAASVQIKKVVTAVDILKAWEQFGGFPEVYNLFIELSQKAVDAGIAVPGATITEKSNIR